MLGKLERWRRPSELARIVEPLRGATALEIGGPSRLFMPGNLLPAYPNLKALDEVNYAPTTLWERVHEASAAGRARRRFILEATCLDGIADGSYDAVLASHVLEHLADPLRALREWRRVARAGGRLLLVVPHRDGTFDHRRNVTPLSHLRADERAATGEDDTTHLQEILAKHDLGRDPWAGSRDAFVRRCQENARHRSLHHHVFVTALVLECVEAAGWEIQLGTVRRPYHIIVLARNPEGTAHPFSSNAWAALLGSSPFPSDRR